MRQKMPAEAESRGAAVLRWLYALLILLMPIRWDFVATANEQANFPLTLPEWLIFTMWPQSLWMTAVWLLLLLTVLIHGRKLTLADFSFRHAGMVVVAGAFLTVVSGIPGLMHTTESGYALDWLKHFGIIAMLTTGVYMTRRQDQKLMPLLLNAVAVGTLLAVLEGWYQHFGGLERNLQEQLENARLCGIPLSEQIIAKMRQTRSYGHFIDPNLYAAHVILTAPVLLAATKNLCSRCVQSRQALWIFMPAVSILSVGAVIFSGSRGALIGLLAGVAAGGWLLVGQRLSKRLLVLLGVLVMLAAAGGLWTMNALTKRDFATASVRMEYYTTAWKIFKSHPLAGAGLGEFFPEHMRLKPYGADEARDAHSMLFSRLAQSGVVGGLAALWQLALPVALALGWLKRHRREDAIASALLLCGWVAWNVHGLLQFNDQVISTAAIAAVYGLFFFRDEEFSRSSSHHSSAGIAVRITAVLLVCGGVSWGVLVDMRGEMTAQLAERESLEKHPVPQEVYRLCNQSMALMPWSVIAPKMANGFALRNDDWTAAEKYATALCRITPHRSSAWTRLAIAQMQQGKSAHEALKQAEEWYPTGAMVSFLKAVNVCVAMPPSLRAPLLKTATARVSEFSQEAVTISLTGPAVNSTVCRMLNETAVRTADGRRIRFVGEN